MLGLREPPPLESAKPSASRFFFGLLSSFGFFVGREEVSMIVSGAARFFDDGFSSSTGSGLGAFFFFFFLVFSRVVVDEEEGVDFTLPFAANISSISEGAIESPFAH